MKVKQLSDEPAITATLRSAAWHQIESVTSDKKLTEREKLNKCLSIANVHAALTGDDSLIPPKLREARDKFISQLPKMLTRATDRAKDRANGQNSLFS